MKTRMIVLCCLMCAACVPTFGGDRPYEYVLDVPKWEQERTDARIELRTAWACLTGRQSSYVLPDTVLSDSIISDARLVNGGELHHVECIWNGMRIEECYYMDTNGNMVEVLGSVSANNGQPYSLSPYHYIGSDGMVTFNTRQWFEMMLWCLNVLVSPWLWLAFIAYLLCIGLWKLYGTRMRKHEQKVHRH